MNCVKTDDFCIKDDELCIQNDGFCIQIDEFCINNDEFCIKTDGFCIQIDEFDSTDCTPNFDTAQDWLNQVSAHKLKKLPVSPRGLLYVKKFTQNDRMVK